MLRSLTHLALGDLPHAASAFGRAWSEAPETGSDVRVFLDEGAPMSRLLEHVAAGGAGQGAGTVAREAARGLLDRLHRGNTSGDGSGLVSPLSSRERDVLRLLDSELTGPEIARELFITVNTLRTHTKHIFAKLGVSTRARAVRRSREDDLLGDRHR
ncbi:MULTISPECIES: helix-turn-helix transcriptional regulator [Arsenicicoccus]|uniref:helix-turn-helix transcriptional regulator n=1 Tax=Arsenicicoccus TaxID=267408 RepID=UPI00257B0DEE|nr:MULTISPECIES: LuxR C-terminal-related transcriptional regulator [Arsenicicoccus]